MRAMVRGTVYACHAHIMRTLPAVMVCVLAFAAMPLFAGISYLDPASIPVNSGEWYLNVWGSNLTGEYGAYVRFDGPAGLFDVKANTSTNNHIVAWVPTAVVEKAGTYDLTVFGISEAGGGPTTPVSNTIRFIVSGADNTPAPTLWVPGNIRAEATDIGGAVVTFETRSEAPVTCNHQSGEKFPLGSTLVTC